MKTKDFIQIWPRVYPIIKATNENRQSDFIGLYEAVYNIPKYEKSDYNLSNKERQRFMSIVNELYDAYYMASPKPKQIKIAGKKYLMREIQKINYPLSFLTVLQNERITSLKSVETPEIVAIQQKQIQGTQLSESENNMIMANLIDANYSLYSRINYIAALALAPIIFKGKINDSDVENLSNILLNHEHTDVLNIAFFLLSKLMTGWVESMNYWHRAGLSHGFQITQKMRINGQMNILA